MANSTQIPGFNPPLNPPVAGAYLTPIELILALLSLAVLLLRLYSRLIILRAPGLDDLLVTLAWLFALATTISHVLSDLLWGWGRHYLDLYQPDAVKLWIAELVHWIAYPLSALFVKLSMCCFFLRLTLGHTNPTRFRMMVYFTMGFMIVWTVGLIVTLFFSCQPLSQWWRYDLPEGKCWSGMALGVIMFVQTTLNLITDVIVFFLPISLVWRAKVSVQKRLQILGVLGLGLVVCVIALVRIKMLLNAIYASDISWYGYSFYVAVAVEMQLCIVCASVPFCKPVLRLWREKLRSKGLWWKEEVEEGSNETDDSEEFSKESGWSRSRSIRKGSAGLGANGKAEAELLKDLESIYDPLDLRDSRVRSLHSIRIGYAV